MTDEKRALKVFLCHAHSDKDAVKALYVRLKREGVDVWLDKEKLLPGADWELEIRKAVREADVVVVCLSKQFNQAGFRQKEVRIALDAAMEKPDGEIFIIPARLEECDTLESLRKWHWVDMFENDGFQRLILALRVRADKIGATLRKRKDGGYITSYSKIKGEQEVVEKADREKVEKGVAEKARLDAKILGKQKAAKAQADREAAEKAVREKTEHGKKADKPNIVIIVALIGLVGITAAIISSPLFEGLSPSATEPPAPLLSTPARTYTKKASTPTAYAGSLPVEITDDKGVIMRLVPAGEFEMGSEDGRPDERPVHLVYLDDFYIDKYEVTNALYIACEEAGDCVMNKSTSSYTRDNSEFGNYPVIFVDWHQANAYCEWRGASLPTEAQWEKAARGTDGRTYPWGEGIDCSKANYWGKDNGCVGDTTSVGSYESGKSPYGIYDLAGNVWEWTADWYSEMYYQNSTSKNPLGSDSGQYRVLRGGTWNYNEYSLRASIRSRNNPDDTNVNIGFRCARSTP